MEKLINKMKYLWLVLHHHNEYAFFVNLKLIFFSLLVTYKLFLKFELDKFVKS